MAHLNTSFTQLPHPQMPPPADINPPPHRCATQLTWPPDPPPLTHHPLPDTSDCSNRSGEWNDPSDQIFSFRYFNSCWIQTWIKNKSQLIWSLLEIIIWASIVASLLCFKLQAQFEICPKSKDFHLVLFFRLSGTHLYHSAQVGCIPQFIFTPSAEFPVRRYTFFLTLCILIGKVTGYLSNTTWVLKLC